MRSDSPSARRSEMVSWPTLGAGMRVADWACWTQQAAFGERSFCQNPNQSAGPPGYDTLKEEGAQFTAQWYNPKPAPVVRGGEQRVMRSTYPATLYVSVSPPDLLGRTIIDCNKAFNPPCTLTTFGTYPFPPRGNHPPLCVLGGEWNPHFEARLTGAKSP